MIRRVIDFSLDNRLLVVIGWTLVAALGLRSMLRLPIDAVPDVTNVQVQVLTDSPGLAPTEVEAFITFPVESAMNGIPRVEQIRSVSRFGLSVVTVVFEEGTDLYWGRQQIAERLAAARAAIPAGYGEPELGPASTGLGEIYQFEVRGAGWSPMELRDLLDWTIAAHLRSVPGVVEVNSFGGELRAWQVTLKPERLVAHGVGVAGVFEALENDNRNVGGGYLVHADEQYVVRGEGLVRTLEDLGDIVVARGEDGTPVYLRSLGDVEFRPVLRQGAVTRDGEREAVVGIVMMRIGENSRSVARDVHARVEELRRTLPAGVTIDTFYDRTELVDRTIRTVATNLAEGGLLVVLVLLLMLGSLRAGLIVALSIPLSMLVAFACMERAGVSGNLMSLGAIDFGLIVDGSVVLVEHVVRRLRNGGAGAVPHLERVRLACHEVARPVAFAVGIILIVYLPILALRGIEGRMFRPMALTVVFAIAGSLACALTLMPVLASLLLRRVPAREPLLSRAARRVYEPLLARALGRPVATGLAAVLVFALGLAVLPFLGAEFIPRLNEGALAMQIWRLPSVALEASNEISLKAERVLKSFPEVTTVVSRTGRAEIATDPMGVEISDTYVGLAPRATWRFADEEELIRAIDRRLGEALPGVLFSYSQPIELRVDELISGFRSEVGVKVFAPDGTLLEMRAVAERIAAVVREVDGISEVKVEQTAGLPTLTIDVDRRALARLGANAEAVLAVVETIGGKPLGVVVDGQKRHRVQVRFDPRVREDLDALAKLPVAIPTGGGGGDGGATRFVPLEQVAQIHIATGPAQISRERIQRKITVELNVRGRDLASAVGEASRRVAEQVDLPPGWSIQWSGEFENLQAAAARLALLVPLALLVIFALLYTALGSGRLAALVFLNVPMAVTGGIFALALRGMPFSISAGVGFIALFGIAVLNGVVLVSAIRDRRTAGLAPDEAVRDAALERLRPVLMTALVASLGFVPMALATSAGAEVQRPLATVVIGGLVTSTLLTLLVLPAVYRKTFGARAR